MSFFFIYIFFVNVSFPIYNGATLLPLRKMILNFSGLNESLKIDLEILFATVQNI